MNLFFVVTVYQHNMSILDGRKAEIWPVEAKRLNRVAHIASDFGIILLELVADFLFVVVLRYLLQLSSCLPIFNLVID